MSTTISYANSPCPKTDAVNDIKNWFGDRWDKVSELMQTVSSQEQFILYAAFAGVQGFPVIAWWELYHGEGSWVSDQ
jgi:hypothetical protein